MLEGFRIEYVNLARKSEVEEVRSFLARFDLSFDADVEFTLIVRDETGAVVGTGSYAGEVLRNIAVDENIQGAGLSSAIISELMRLMGHKGVLHYFIYTRPQKAFLFESLGFKEIARAEPHAALLEGGMGSVVSYCAAISEEINHLSTPRAAIVMNANPFTKGHLALIQKAAEENASVIVFTVREDCSLFPFKDRIKLIRAATASMPNVAVVSTEEYMVSAATFPTYFTRDGDQVAAQTRLDINLFVGQIAPRLFINARYIGEEPYCDVTRAYNAAILEILPSAGIRVELIPRLAESGEAVSASRVRELIRKGDMQGLENLLPGVTLEYLRAEENRHIIESIRQSHSRH